MNKEDLQEDDHDIEYQGEVSGEAQEAEILVTAQELAEAQPELGSSEDSDNAAWESVSTALVPTTTLDRYLAEVRRYPFLTKEEELRLFHEYHVKGRQDAAVKLILANLRVSIAIASEYGHVGIDQMDLIQEGNVGLLQAMKKFDPTKTSDSMLMQPGGYVPLSYGIWLIIFVLSKLAPPKNSEIVFNLRKEKAKLEQQGFVPDPKLIADRLHVRERDVVEMDQRLGSWELSLDQPMNEEGEGTFYDLLPSTQAGADEQLAESQLRIIFRKKLGQFAKTLNEREEDILRNRLLSESPITLEELGKKYSITKERARQLEGKIIKRLREFMKSELKDFDQLRQ